VGSLADGDHVHLADGDPTLPTILAAKIGPRPWISVSELQTVPGAGFASS